MQVQESSRGILLSEGDIDNSTWFSLSLGGGENLAKPAPVRSLSTSSVERSSPLPQARIANTGTNSRGMSKLLLTAFVLVIYILKYREIGMFFVYRLKIRSLLFNGRSLVLLAFCEKNSRLFVTRSLSIYLLVLQLLLLIFFTTVMLGLGSNGPSQRLMDSRPPMRSHFSADGHPFPVRPRSSPMHARRVYRKIRMDDLDED